MVHQNPKYFALFVREFPDYQNLYDLWQEAVESNDVRNQAHVAEKLRNTMLVNGWG
ncbi:hypothetical protein NSQ29_01510 [Paenibacillus sp. FSL F4-0236]|uniref:hypothetical protein n=1 Tax=Paenibacillus sp. FSL F4-0236 TaxID=2954731 RepID=UPI0030F6D07A